MFRPSYQSGRKQEDFDFPLQCIVLKVIGVWPVEYVGDLDKKGIRYQRSYKAYSVIVIFLIAITCSAQAFFFYSKWGDLLVVTESGCTVFMGTYNLLRYIHLTYNRNTMKSLMQEFLDNVYVSRSSSKRIHEQCEKAGIIMKFMSGLLFTLISIYVLLPLFELFFGKEFVPDYQDPETKTFLYDTLKPFPYPMLFPYDANSGLSYVLTYFYTSFSGFVVISVLFGEDSLFCYFLMHTCGRYKVLHEDIRKLRQKADLKEVISLHNTIIHFCNKLEEFFSPILLVNFLVSSFLICLVGFQLATVRLLQIFCSF